MKSKKAILCILIILVILIGIGIYYYTAYANQNKKITEGTLVKGIEKIIKEKTGCEVL
ncbi:MAG TPA: hypothetical protein IAC41_01895 [Candidatus Merdenecus merdavium]|nr:hypothetical protein [Candidatus Merdenecus merdavium]